MPFCIFDIWVFYPTAQLEITLKIDLPYFYSKPFKYSSILYNSEYWKRQREKFDCIFETGILSKSTKW